MRIRQRGENEILEHLDVVFRHDLGIERDLLHLLVAVHDDGDHAAAGGGFDLRLAHLLLQALLHLLGLLHHLIDVHDRPLVQTTDLRPAETTSGGLYISSTSLISAGNTSSIACTAG